MPWSASRYLVHSSCVSLGALCTVRGWVRTRQCVVENMDSSGVSCNNKCNNKRCRILLIGLAILEFLTFSFLSEREDLDEVETPVKEEVIQGKSPTKR